MFSIRIDGRHLAALLAVLLLALGAAACRGGSKKVDINATIAGTLEPPTPAADATQAATPLTADEQTVVAIGPGIDYVPYADPAGAFTAEVPRGWGVLQSTGSVTFQLPDNGVTMAVVCESGVNTQQLLDEDKRAFANINLGTTTYGAETEATVAGVTAHVVPWDTVLGEARTDHIWVYFDGNGCAWRFALNTVATRLASTWMPVLTHLMDTFKPG